MSKRKKQYRQSTKIEQVADEILDNPKIHGYNERMNQPPILISFLKSVQRWINDKESIYIINKDVLGWLVEQTPEWEDLAIPLLPFRDGMATYCFDMTPAKYLLKYKNQEKSKRLNSILLSFRNEDWRYASLPVEIRGIQIDMITESPQSPEEGVEIVSIKLEGNLLEGESKCITSFAVEQFLEEQKDGRLSSETLLSVVRFILSWCLCFHNQIVKEKDKTTPPPNRNSRNKGKKNNPSKAPAQRPYNWIFLDKEGKGRLVSAPRVRGTRSGSKIKFEIEVDDYTQWKWVLRTSLVPTDGDPSDLDRMISLKTGSMLYRVRREISGYTKGAGLPKRPEVVRIRTKTIVGFKEEEDPQPTT